MNWFEGCVSYFTLVEGFRPGNFAKRAATPQGDVRFGSKEDFRTAKNHLRFTSTSGHLNDPFHIDSDRRRHRSVSPRILQGSIAKVV
jgi:hypothetical protein